ncbi:MAG: YqjK family protein [Candidatus Dasytiphilus stammeri]
MNHYDYNQPKHRLLDLVQEQRINLTSEYKEWKKILSNYQRKLLIIRNRIIIIISILSIITLFLAHHPRRLIRWSKRAMAIWKMCQLLRKYSH